MKKIKIYKNDTEQSKEAELILINKLKDYDVKISDELTDDCSLLVCIGGDGAFLEAIHLYEFPNVPIIGINTGHLGFFQEISVDEIDQFLENFFSNSYQIQTLNLVEATVTLADSEFIVYGVNEIVIKGENTRAIHLSISIGDKFIERCSGDGILVGTAAGSTAYNYSIGGSIVDPRIKLIQVTPIAPMNTTSYRSFTSSILLPSDLPLGVVPEDMHDEDNIHIINDGIHHVCQGVKKVDIRFSEKTVRLLRFEHYYFWDKVKSKFL